MKRSTALRYVLHGLPIVVMVCSLLPALAQFDEERPNGPSRSLVAGIEAQMRQYVIPGASVAVIKDYRSHTGGTSDFRYSGYRYGYYEDPASSIDAIPTMHEELYGLQPANTPPIKVIRPPGVTWVYSPAGYRPAGDAYEHLSRAFCGHHERLSAQAF